MIKRKTDCSVLLAGVEIPLSFRFAETEKHFYNYICPVTSKAEPLYVDDRLWEELSDVEKEKIPGSWTEFYQLTGLVSRYLLHYKRCVYHGVAILWHGLAWIITAQSGVGKTTQFCLWKKLFGNEIELINGDKPIIECRPDDTVWVYPSPWNGKENYSGSKNGRLAGIIYLEQADHNEIQRMEIRSAVVPLFLQFLIYADSEEEILAAGHLENVILRNIPVWKLRNLGNESSVELTRSTLLQYLEDRE